jgi:hypothetical protein
MKGRVPEQEISELSSAYCWDIIPLEVPFTEGERCLVRIRAGLTELSIDSTIEKG